MANLKVRLETLGSAEWGLTAATGVIYVSRQIKCSRKEEEEDNVEQRSPAHRLLLF